METVKMNKLEQIINNTTSVDVKLDGRTAWRNTANVGGSLTFIDAYGDTKEASFSIHRMYVSYRADKKECGFDKKWNIMGSDAVAPREIRLSVKNVDKDGCENTDYILSQDKTDAGYKFFKHVRPKVRKVMQAERRHDLATARLDRNLLLERVDVKAVIQEQIDMIIELRKSDSIDNRFNPNFVATGNISYDPNHWINNDDMIPGNMFEKEEGYKSIVGKSIDEILALWLDDGLGKPLTRSIETRFVARGYGSYGENASLTLEYKKMDNLAYCYSQAEKSAAKKGYVFSYNKVTSSGAWTTQSATSIKTVVRNMNEQIRDAFWSMGQDVRNNRDAAEKLSTETILESKINAVVDSLGITLPEQSKESGYGMSWEEEQKNRALGLDKHGNLKHPGVRRFPAHQLVKGELSRGKKVVISSDIDSDKIAVSIRFEDYKLFVTDADNVINAVAAILTRVKDVQAIKDAAQEQIEALGELSI